MLGSGGVGKSAMTIRFVRGAFITDYDPTIEDSYRKTVNVDNVAADLEILDTAGQEEYNTLRESYMRRGKGFMLVYAVDDRQSFEEVKELEVKIRRVKDMDKGQVPIVIAANKCDLTEGRAIQSSEGKAFADSMNVSFIECSAKTDTNVEAAFDELLRSMRQKDTSGAKKGCTLL